MGNAPQVSSDSLPVSALLAIDKICRQFEAELETERKPWLTEGNRTGPASVYPGLVPFSLRGSYNATSSSAQTA